MSDGPSPPADTIERLQFWKHHAEAYAPHPTWFFHNDLDRACDEILRLRAALKQAQEALA